MLKSSQYKLIYKGMRVSLLDGVGPAELERRIMVSVWLNLTGIKNFQCGDLAVNAAGLAQA